MDFSQLTFDQRLAYALALADTNTVLPTAYRHNAGAILFAMEMGEAAGLANISAVLNGIHLIPDSSGDVKPTISVNMMTAAVLKNGFTLEETYDETTHTATVTLTRPAATGTKKQTYTSVWDEQRARRAHLWGSSTFWTQHTQEMLTNRAVAEVCRRHAADVLNGLIYTPEEISSDHEKKFAHAFAPVKAEIDYLKLDDETLKNLTGFTLDDLQSRTAEELATEILPTLISYEHERNAAETVDIKAEIEALSAALTGMSPGAKRALIKKCVAPSRTPQRSNSIAQGNGKAARSRSKRPRKARQRSRARSGVCASASAQHAHSRSCHAAARTPARSSSRAAASPAFERSTA